MKRDSGIIIKIRKKTERKTRSQIIHPGGTLLQSLQAISCEGMVIRKKAQPSKPRSFRPSQVLPLYHWPHPMKKKLSRTAIHGFRFSGCGGKDQTRNPQPGQIPAFLSWSGFPQFEQNFGIPDEESYPTQDNIFSCILK